MAYKKVTYKNEEYYYKKTEWLDSHFIKVSKMLSNELDSRFLTNSVIDKKPNDWMNWRVLRMGCFRG